MEDSSDLLGQISLAWYNCWYAVSQPTHCPLPRGTQVPPCPWVGSKASPVHVPPFRAVWPQSFPSHIHKTKISRSALQTDKTQATQTSDAKPSSMTNKQWWLVRFKEKKTQGISLFCFFLKSKALVDGRVIVLLKSPFPSQHFYPEVFMLNCSELWTLLCIF